jgi:hypothetical protein
MNNRARIVLVSGLLGLAGVAGIAVAIAGQGGHHGFGMGPMGDGGPRWHRGGGRKLHMLEQLDTNKDKKLTQEEIDEARSTLLTSHDTNKDGQLTLQEFEAVWLEQMRQMMVRQFQRLDRDGNAVVTVEEFSKPFSGIVARLDRNDDKVLDESDRGRGRHGWWRDRDGNRGDETERAPAGGAN